MSFVDEFLDGGKDLVQDEESDNESEHKSSQKVEEKQSLNYDSKPEQKPKRNNYFNDSSSEDEQSEEEDEKDEQKEENDQNEDEEANFKFYSYNKQQESEDEEEEKKEAEQKKQPNSNDDESSEEEEEEERSRKVVKNEKKHNFSFTSSDSDEKLSPQEKAFNKFLDEKHKSLPDKEDKSEKGEDEEEGEDFYQLSDVENSQLQSSQKVSARSQAKDQTEQNFLKSSITKVLDSQIQQFGSSVGSLCSDKQSIIDKEEEYKKRGNNEITFGDLSSDHPSDLIRVAKNYQYNPNDSLGNSKVKPPLHNSIITEDDQENDLSYSLNYSQVSGNQSMQRFQKTQATNSSQMSKAQGLVVKALLEKRSATQKTKALEAWKNLKMKDFYQVKLRNAAQMVDKMSRFSRSFISLNSLSAMLDKNRQRKLAKAMFRWSKYGKINSNSEPTSSNKQNQEVEELRSELEIKEKEIHKMEKMFKEYSSWTHKLEEIEEKMKKEVQYWKESCDKLQKENESLQKEALKVTQQLLEKTKYIEAKEETISTLQKQLKVAKASFDPVEEVLCKNCSNSLEESQVFTKESLRMMATPDQQDQIRALSEKLEELERQIMTYRERVSYHESMEDELKKNIEQQVDVVLKMEEERLIMLKENKEIKESNRKMKQEAQEKNDRIELFEKELEEVREQLRSKPVVVKEDILSDSDTATSKEVKNKENKSQNKKKPVTSKAKPSLKKAKPSLQFLKSNESQMSFSSCTDESKYAQKPLSTDTQILTSELVTMNREISKLKAELRSTQESLKKSEKEKYEGKKSIESKENALEKLRKERDELWAIVNTDKYKNIKSIEQEREKAEKHRTELENQLTQLRKQVEDQSKQISAEQEKISELEIDRQRLQDKEISTQKLLKILEEKNSKLELEWEKSDSSVGTLRKEVDNLRIENGKMKKDLDWVANSAKNNKIQADRAIADLEAYTKILRGMEKKLAMSEVEKEAKDQELKEMKTKFMQMMQSFQQSQPPVAKPQNTSYQQPTWQNVSVQQQMQGYNHQPRGQKSVPQPQQPPQRFDQTY